MIYMVNFQILILKVLVEELPFNLVAMVQLFISLEDQKISWILVQRKSKIEEEKVESVLFTNLCTCMPTSI